MLYFFYHSNRNGTVHILKFFCCMSYFKYLKWSLLSTLFTFIWLHSRMTSFRSLKMTVTGESFTSLFTFKLSLQYGIFHALQGHCDIQKFQHTNYSYRVTFQYDIIRDI